MVTAEDPIVLNQKEGKEKLSTISPVPERPLQCLLLLWNHLLKRKIDNVPDFVFKSFFENFSLRLCFHWFFSSNGLILISTSFENWSDKLRTEVVLFVNSLVLTIISLFLRNLSSIREKKGHHLELKRQNPSDVNYMNTCLKKESYCAINEVFVGRNCLCFSSAGKVVKSILGDYVRNQLKIAKKIISVTTYYREFNQTLTSCQIFDTKSDTLKFWVKLW